MKTEQSNFRLNSEIKQKAYEILRKLGVTPSQAVNIFMADIVACKGLPFRPHLPNKKTIKAMKENVSNLKSYDNFEIFLNDYKKR